MEFDRGVFVSNIATTEGWEFDAEVNGEAHVLVEEETAFAGMERYVDPIEPLSWTLPEREVVLILEGAVRIEIEGGPTLDLKVGDMASIPKGAVTRWHITVPFKEMWFFGRPYEQAGGLTQPTARRRTAHDAGRGAAPTMTRADTSMRHTPRHDRHDHAAPPRPLLVAVGLHRRGPRRASRGSHR